MSDQDNKKPKDPGDIPFFRIETNGDIAPAFDGSKPASSEEADDLQPLEPIFDPASADLSPPISEPMIELESPLGSPIESSIQIIAPFAGGPEGTNPEGQAPSNNTNSGGDTGSLRNALDQLKPEIESITRIEHREDISDAQVDILKRYVSLKESETRDLKEQLRQFHSFSKKQATELAHLQNKFRESLEQLTVLREREEASKRDIYQLKERHADEIEAIRNDYEQRVAQGSQVAEEAANLERKREEWKDRVREDLKRIKLKERELENKYELLKRDTQALLDSKDRHVLELKKKNDALELEMESLEDRLRRTNQILQSIESKKKRLLETMKLASTLLEKIDEPSGNADSPVLPFSRKKDGTQG